MTSNSTHAQKLAELRQEIAALQRGLRTAEDEYVDAVCSRDEIIRRVRLVELDAEFARADQKYHTAKTMRIAIRNALERAEQRAEKLEQH